jgi:hypothetical protein
VIEWSAELLLNAKPGDAPRTVLVPGRLRDRGSTAPSLHASSVVEAVPEEVVI